MYTCSVISMILQCKVMSGRICIYFSSWSIYVAALFVALAWYDLMMYRTGNIVILTVHVQYISVMISSYMVLILLREMRLDMSVGLMVWVVVQQLIHVNMCRQCQGQVDSPTWKHVRDQLMQSRFLDANEMIIIVLFQCQTEVHDTNTHKLCYFLLRHALRWLSLLIEKQWIPKL